MNTSYPEKLYVELTTLCNLGCAMCVKHSSGWSCADQHMDFQVYEALLPLFSHLSTLNLNGIGEPLLHPQLTEFIRLARENMADKAVVGFQSNGMLLTPRLADELMHNGLNRICFSVDAPEAEMLERFRAGAELNQVAAAFAMMRDAAARPDTLPLQLGAQTVVSANNCDMLPEMVRWCAKREAQYMIVSHVLPYGRHDAEQSIFEPVAERCLDFFKEWEKTFVAEGMELQDFYKAFYAFFRTPAQQRLVQAVQRMVEEARARELEFSLPNVLRVDFDRLSKVRDIFAHSEEVATTCGIRLELPALAAREPRKCAFVESPSLFVSVDGALTPCYYLWHSCTSWLGGSEMRVGQRVFGRVPADNPLSVWRSDPFRRFRREARAEEYPRCADCNVVPCDFIQGFPNPFEKDCYDQVVPCGGCPWSGGGFACLQ